MHMKKNTGQRFISNPGEKLNKKSRYKRHSNTQQIKIDGLPNGEIYPSCFRQ